MDIVPSPSSTIWKRKYIQYVQRSIEAHNQRNGQHWIIRIWRDVQNKSMPIVLKIFQRRNSLLLMWKMSYALAWTNRKDQESNWHHIKSTLHHKRRLVKRTSWTSTEAVRSLESKLCNYECTQERTWHYRAPMSYWPTKPKVSIVTWMDSWVLQEPGLPPNRQCGPCCLSAWKRSIPEHARIEVHRRKESWKDVRTRWF